MNFADKLIQLRKQAGWSQEDLAQQMNVTRQSVSKWEGEQSVPDIEKVVQLSKLFHVSTDYLLKDEMDNIEFNKSIKESSAEYQRIVTRQEANSFLTVKARTAKSIAYATFLCILSPICLFILSALSESKEYDLSENIAACVGLIVLLIIVAIAVMIYISSGAKTAPFAYLEKECFQIESGVSEMVNNLKSQYESTYTRKNIIGVSLCIVSIIPLFIGVMWDEQNDILLTIMLSATLVLAGIGVVLLIRNGIIWASYEKLLQEGDYTEEKKKESSLTDAVGTAYWLIATAIYLGCSFTTDDWKHSWIIWVVAGLLFPAVLALTRLLHKKES